MQSITLQSGDARFRVASSIPNVIESVGRSFADAVCDDDALAAFVLKPPSAHGGLSVLLSGSGRILARSRDPQALVTVLHRMLTAIMAPPPVDGVVRLGVRALTNGSDVILLGPGVAERPPLAERRLERLGWAVVDAPFIDLSLVDGRLVPLAARQSTIAEATITEVVGHRDPVQAAGLVSTFLWYAADRLPEPTSGQLVHAIASQIMTGTRDDRLRTGWALARSITSETVGAEVNEVFDRLT